MIEIRRVWTQVEDVFHEFGPRGASAATGRAGGAVVLAHGDIAPMDGGGSGRLTCGGWRRMICVADQATVARHHADGFYPITQMHFAAVW